MRLIDYFDRLYIIHLPERVDRFQALKSELSTIGVDIHDPKVRLPEPIYTSDTHGFPSVGVYCNFTRHLRILQECLVDGVDRVWILEDDAIFRHQLRREEEQDKIIQRLSQNDWDLCFLGHNISSQELSAHRSGLIPFAEGFKLAHCYCVNGRVLPLLVKYFEETSVNPPGHPRGGKMYIDGAYNLFRQLHPEVVCLVSNPNSSNQKGSPSNLAHQRWYDKSNVVQPIVSSMRSLRDEIWRLS